MIGIRKLTALNVLKHSPLKKLGNLDSEEDEIMAQANKIVAKC